MNDYDENKRPPSRERTFVPAERWVLPAHRPTRSPERRDAPDDEDASKRFPSAGPIKTFLDEDFTAPANDVAAEPPPGRARMIVQAGFGLCVSIVLAACGGRDNRPTHVGPPLGDTHVSQGPSDPTVPPPDAADYDQPSPAYEMKAPSGPAPVPPVPASQQPAPTPAPQPGVFSPPPAPTGPADVPQPEIPKP